VRVDITTESVVGFARSFAPTWPMVMGYKNRTLGEAQYIEQYRKILLFQSKCGAGCTRRPWMAKSLYCVIAATIVSAIRT